MNRACIIDAGSYRESAEIACVPRQGIDAIRPTDQPAPPLAANAGAARPVLLPLAFNAGLTDGKIERGRGKRLVPQNEMPPLLSVGQEPAPPHGIGQQPAVGALGRGDS